ncbi:MAG: hypothetical protein QOE70_6600 [Chthoniobacter sp.]|jgi:hypothetical protein|nr:hypothetical protein [Chthoniobacter sp.]
MPNIPIRVHGIVDYAAGILLVASAFVLPYPDNPMKMIAVVFGAIILLYSAMTDYPLGLLRFVPFPIHRTADLFAGGGLAFAPIHFAVHGIPAALFVTVGALLILMAFLTRGRFSPTGQDNPVVPGA